MENKLINKLEISGYANYVKRNQTAKGTITTFSLSLYAGKKNEKTQYGNIKCTCFFDAQIEDKQQVVITGKLRAEKYVNKEGKEVSNPLIMVDLINGIGADGEQAKDDAFIDDGIVF